MNKRMEKRLDEIQNWLGFPDDCLEAWKKLGSGFQVWMIGNATKDSEEQVRGRFPIFWKRYLRETGHTDEIPWGH